MDVAALVDLWRTWLLAPLLRRPPSARYAILLAAYSFREEWGEGGDKSLMP